MNVTRKHLAIGFRSETQKVARILSIPSECQSAFVGQAATALAEGTELPWKGMEFRLETRTWDADTARAARVLLEGLRLKYWKTTERKAVKVQDDLFRCIIVLQTLI